MIWSATSCGAIAQSVDTDLTGVKVRSNPAIAEVVERELRAMNDDSSRGSFGARPCASVNISRPTSVRIRARSAAARTVSARSPLATLTSTARRATAIWKAGVSSGRGNGLPSSVAAACAVGEAPAAARSSVILSALGCRPSANSDAIWSAVTPCPAVMSTSANADPAHRPGTSPRWL